MDADLRAAVLKVAGEYDLAGKISSYNKYLGPRASFPKIQSKVEQVGWALLNLIEQAKEAAQ